MKSDWWRLKANISEGGVASDCQVDDSIQQRECAHWFYYHGCSCKSPFSSPRNHAKKKHDKEKTAGNLQIDRGSADRQPRSGRGSKHRQQEGKEVRGRRIWDAEQERVPFSSRFIMMAHTKISLCHRERKRNTPSMDDYYYYHYYYYYYSQERSPHCS